MTCTVITQKNMSLGAIQPGESVRIQGMQGGHHLLSRLASLGFVPGVCLRVIQNYGHGPLIVRLRDTQVALGRGEAQKILVERTSGEQDG